ncbi:hypothetical protein D9757_013861 [Collybiopsis confluens]|uniref:Uncharacterized protein n=1 Tax=Collybiopsis confluens TaxID=2823264 RepID=A0A8H5FYU7_9AGAR|nr:hypothetical protein D9757_013861 [Collybiopsis confluens]
MTTVMSGWTYLQADISSLSFFVRSALRQHQNGAGFQSAIRDEDHNLAASFGQPFYNQPPFLPVISHYDSATASQATTTQTRHNLVAAPHFGPTGSSPALPGSGLSTATKTRMHPRSRVALGSQRPLLPCPFTASRPLASASNQAAPSSSRHYVPSRQKSKQAFAPIRRTSGRRPSDLGDVPFAGLADPVWDLSNPGNSGDIGQRSNPPAPSQSQTAQNQIDALKVAMGSWGGGRGRGSNIAATTTGFPKLFDFPLPHHQRNSTLPSSSPSNSRPLPSNANPSQFQHGPLTIKIPSATQRGVDLLEHAVEEKGQLDADDIVSSSLDLSESSRHLYSSAAAHSYSHHHRPTIIIPPAVQLGEEPRRTARKKKKSGPSTELNSGDLSENPVIPPLSFRFFFAENRV